MVLTGHDPFAVTRSIYHNIRHRLPDVGRTTQSACRKVARRGPMASMIERRSFRVARTGTKQSLIALHTLKLTNRKSSSTFRKF